MFSTLTQVFQGDRDPAQEKLTSRTQIVAILRQLKADHELLSATVSGSGVRSNTAILGIKEGLGSFYLDELNTTDGHLALLKNREATIQCRLHGMDLDFTCKLLKAGKKDGIAVYEMSIPGSMVRAQRRQNFRLQLNPGLTVPVTIPSLEGKRTSGQAFDLSASGIGLFVNTRNPPDSGQILHDLCIAVPHYRPLETSVEVRFARLDSAHHSLRLGGRFVGLDRKQERLLSQFLAEQQRKRRRYNPR